MNKNLRMTLSRAIAESTVEGSDGFFTAKLTTDLLNDITMPHDTIAFDIAHPDGITTIRVKPHLNH